MRKPARYDSSKLISFVPTLFYSSWLSLFNLVSCEPTHQRNRSGLYAARATSRLYRAFALCATLNFNMNGFIKYKRGDISKSLHSKPNENHLLNIIAVRVSRNGNPVKGVKVGEALIGDYGVMGLKRQPYRTALTNLRKWGFITIRTTNAGTYASLSNSTVYDCNVNAPNQQPNQQLTNHLTNDQPATQPTANHYQEVKKKEVKNKEERNKHLSDYFEVANFFKSHTGKQIVIKDKPELAITQSKFKILKKRFEEGATVEQCLEVIKLKTKEWKNDNYMKKYLDFDTLFNKTKFEKYLDELEATNEVSKVKNFTYALPTFQDAEDRQLYFLGRFTAYRGTNLLDEFKVNTEYRKRAIMEQDAEGLCFELELEIPELLNVEFNPRR